VYEKFRRMTRYRIVKRPSAGTYCYFAQKKVLFWWVDLPQHSLSEWKGLPSCETPSHSQELVERYIENILMDIVVKTYD
jgi:hypothetical protein